MSSINLTPSPIRWRHSCVGSENTMHQLSPYIGKLKSSIASQLIEDYTQKGDFIVDPFSGSGTIALEAHLKQRKVFAADCSPYASVLTRAKLTPPRSLEDALHRLNIAQIKSGEIEVNLKKIPEWVKAFYHPQTLLEAKQFAIWTLKNKEWFLLACLLGILHHQRPGFLSYPSSHLVPYLRDKSFPRDLYPDLYKYRDYRPRIEQKIIRAYRRHDHVNSRFKQTYVNSEIERLNLPKRVDAIITSPPYMNALNYGRDNRLRLWFLGENFSASDTLLAKSPVYFEAFFNRIITAFSKSLKRNGKLVLIVGNGSKGKFVPSDCIEEILNANEYLSCINIYDDEIPDIRRSRRECRAVKNEKIFVYERKN